MQLEYFKFSKQLNNTIYNLKENKKIKEDEQFCIELIYIFKNYNKGIYSHTDLDFNPRYIYMCILELLIKHNLEKKQYFKKIENELNDEKSNYNKTLELLNQILYFINRNDNNTEIDFYGGSFEFNKFF